jgi:hypothetical protein
MRHYLLLGLSLALAGCASTKPLPHYTEAEKAAQRQAIGYWQPTPAKPDSTSGPRVEPGSQADLHRSIFGGHPQVVQQDIEATLDSLKFVKVAKAPRRLFGLLPAKKPASTALGKCKGCTFNLVAGNQTNQHVDKKGQLLGDGNTQTGKKSGDIIKADSGAIVNKVGGPGNAQTTKGNNNTPTLTAPVQQASDWKAVLAKPAGEVAATAVGLGLLAGLGYLFFLWRKKKAAEAIV